MLFKKVESHSFNDWFKDSNLNSMDDIWMRCHLTSLCQNLKLLCCDQTLPKLFEIRQSKRSWHVFYYVYQMCEHWYFYLKKKIHKNELKKMKNHKFFCSLFNIPIFNKTILTGRSKKSVSIWFVGYFKLESFNSKINFFFTELRLTF